MIRPIKPELPFIWFSECKPDNVCLSTEDAKKLGTYINDIQSYTEQLNNLLDETTEPVESE